MPDLLHSLQYQDIGHLRIIAELWGFELKSDQLQAAREGLCAALLQSTQIQEIVGSLPTHSQQALGALIDAQGRIPWAAFARQFGEIREMGAAKRDREQPHLRPVSAAEPLFYRGLIGRAFFDTDRGPQEFAYIPDDLLELIRMRPWQKNLAASAADPEPLGRAASLAERARIIPASDRILDDATTLLAGIRAGIEIDADPKLLALLQEARLLKKNVIQAAPVKGFLEADRPTALRVLLEAWHASETFNELRLIPALVFEGEWKNPILETRRAMLAFIDRIPLDTWWGVHAFIQDVKVKHPDFQRPAGDYDSWFIKRQADGAYLRGFPAWDEVDGALLRYFIRILHWLGKLDLAVLADGSNLSAFKVLPLGGLKQTPQDGKFHLSAQGQLTVPRRVPRAVRYQLARFCEWDEDKPDEYRYHLTPQSLTRAKAQGLKVEHLLALLANHAQAGIPPVLVKALKRWENKGTEARAENHVVLRVSAPEVLEKLRKSKAARFLGEPLGPTAVIIKSGAQARVLAALAEMGLLAEDKTEIKKA